MNRFDRITALLIQLQSRRVVKGQDLAERFGVSLRTVYRDLRTLEEAGVPLFGEPGVGYSLADGYRLPPVMFTREEATALLIGEQLVGRLADAATARLSTSAMDKLRAVLRGPDRDFLEALSPRITVLSNRGTMSGASQSDSNAQQLLLSSIANRQVVSLQYKAGYNGTGTERDIEPIAVYFGQHWHVVGFCRLRQEFRDFRLDRIAGLQVRPEQFMPRPETLQSYWAAQQERLQAYAAKVRIGPTALPQVQEGKHHFGWTSEAAQSDGSVEMTFLTGRLDFLARWLLPFGPQVDIVSPAELRERLCVLAREAFAHFQ